MTLDGILDGEKWVYDIQPAKLYGMDIHTAEDKSERRGFLINPSAYAFAGRDQDFRPAYKKIETVKQ